MNQIGAWVGEIRERVAALGSNGRVIGVDVGAETAHVSSLGHAGFPGVLSLWSDGRHRTVGLLARPHTPVNEWPAVVVKDVDGLTIASNARTLLPQVIVTRVLSNAPDTGARLAEQWDAVRESAEALHRTLGGDAQSLDAVIAVALDVEARRSLLYAEDKVPRYESAHSALFRRVDHSSAFVRYADWLDAAVAQTWRPVEAPTQYGPWARRLICSAQLFRLSYGVDLDLRREWLDWLIEGGAGVDSGVPSIPTWDVRVGASSGESALAEAAEQREDAAGSSQEPAAVADGLAAALLEQGSSYTGIAHAEAAVALDEGGQPERAWEALQSAAWWSARNTGSTPDTILQGMLFLAERHGWEEITWVVQRSMSG